MSTNPFKDARILISVIVTIVLVVTVIIGSQQIMRWRADAAQNKTRGGVIEATSGIIDDASHAREERTTDDGGVIAARVNYGRSAQEARTNEPSTRTYGAQPVPRSLRDLARERRLARERLGCVGGERQGECAEADAPEREDLLRRGQQEQR